MANEMILERLEGIRRALVAFFESGTTGSGHSTIAGDEREIFVSHFLREVLPPQYRIGSGMITDAGQRKSAQLDIVVELPFTPSFSFIPSTPRVYLADTIGSVIEVKSNLEGYLTGRKKGTAKDKFITGATDKRGRKLYDGLKDIKRSVYVIEMSNEEASGQILRVKPSYTIPAYVVGYKGQQKETLRKHIDQLNRKGYRDRADVVRGILQLEPPLFVGSNGEDWEDRQAIGAFINSLHWELHRTSSLSWPNLRSYFGIDQTKDSGY